MIDNYLSVLLGILEMFCYAGIAFGFPFVEFIMKEEGIFNKESCSSREGLCEKALQQYNTIFTAATASSVSLIL